jgi:ketosteroid isomerase-like protein
MLRTLKKICHLLLFSGMKTYIRTLTLCLATSLGLVLTSAAADSNGVAAKDRNTEEVIKRLESEMIAAALKNDVTKLESFMASDFVNVTDDGEIQHGEESFKEMKSGALKLTKVELGTIEVHTFGDVATAIYIVTGEGTFEGKQFSGRYATTDVFRRIGSEWKIVSSQTTKVKAR